MSLCRSLECPPILTKKEKNDDVISLIKFSKYQVGNNHSFDPWITRTKYAACNLPVFYGSLAAISENERVNIFQFDFMAQNSSWGFVADVQSSSIAEKQKYTRCVRNHGLGEEACHVCR